MTAFVLFLRLARLNMTWKQDGEFISGWWLSVIFLPLWIFNLFRNDLSSQKFVKKIVNCIEVLKIPVLITDFVCDSNPPEECWFFSVICDTVRCFRFSQNYNFVPAQWVKLQSSDVFVSWGCYMSGLFSMLENKSVNYLFWSTVIE